MQSVSSRIWTRVAVSISYDDNHYTTGTFASPLLMSFHKASDGVQNIWESIDKTCNLFLLNLV